jgi:hypothetical protein
MIFYFARKILFESTLNRSLTDSDFTAFDELGKYPQIVSLEDCGIQFANPRDDGTALARKYTNMSVSEYRSAEASWRLITQRDAKFVDQLMPSKGSVLEIGCQAGLL